MRVELFCYLFVPLTVLNYLVVNGVYFAQLWIKNFHIMSLFLILKVLLLAVLLQKSNYFGQTGHLDFHTLQPDLKLHECSSNEIFLVWLQYIFSKITVRVIHFIIKLKRSNHFKFSTLLDIFCQGQLFLFSHVFRSFVSYKQEKTWWFQGF